MSLLDFFPDGGKIYCPTPKAGVIIIIIIIPSWSETISDS